MHAFLSRPNLAHRPIDRQTDKRTRACGRKHIPPSLSEVNKIIRTESIQTNFTDKTTNDCLLKKAGTEHFCYRQLRKESFLIMVMCYGKKETAWRKKQCKLLLLVKEDEEDQYTLAG